jgi:hypothetical protein
MDPVLGGVTAALLIMLQGAALFRTEWLGEEAGGADSLIEGFGIFPERHATKTGEISSVKRPWEAALAALAASLTIQAQIGILARPWRPHFSWGYEPIAIRAVAFVFAIGLFPLSEWLGNQVRWKRHAIVGTREGGARGVRSGLLSVFWLACVGLAHFWPVADYEVPPKPPVSAHFVGVVEGRTVSIWCRSDRPPANGRLWTSVILAVQEYSANEISVNILLPAGDLETAISMRVRDHPYDLVRLSRGEKGAVAVLKTADGRTVRLPERGNSQVAAWLSR